MATSPHPPPDTVTTELIRAALAAAAEEASIVVVRASHSTFIQEGADACAALLDASGNLVAQSTATSLMHSASLSCTVPEVLRDIPASTMRPGDVYVTNDPYRGGIHANDLVVIRPVFAPSADAAAEAATEASTDTAPLFFAGTLIHVADLGGAVAGGLAAVATDTFHEGLLLPPVALEHRGEPVDAVWRILLRNSRTPDAVAGDVRALVAGTRTLAARVEELMGRYDAATVRSVAGHWTDYAETRTRHEIAALPDGTWHGSYTIETDGVESGREHVVAAEVTIAGDTVTVDLTGTSGQARGAINSSRSQTISGVLYAVRCFLAADIPVNDGCLRPLDIRLSPGSLVDPEPPAACGGRVVTVAAVIEAVVEALAQACPERAVAASGLVHVYALAAGRGARTGDGARAPWLALLYEFGGIGARTASDGPDATGAYFLGGRSVVPQLEPLEAAYPVVFRHARLRTDSGGPGRTRGGLGTDLAIEATEPAVLTVRGDRMSRPPAGRGGGEPGGAGRHEVRRAADGRVQALAPKQTGIDLEPGDVFVVGTSGGGGLGDPFERAPDLVAEDVRDGRVSAEAARRTYGVVCTPDGRLDLPATRDLRIRATGATHTAASAHTPAGAAGAKHTPTSKDETRHA
ncbi:hydantoinase B/oxoprolinase family protein [Yinghuangia sp. YIM S09857]|uniref:hydantoinase B/oxoprolinase family protein n=1 Tax=Yinghuangia sp. YIM S09857 TaxID=3436929 RepID=UPI003F53A21E